MDIAEAEVTPDGLLSAHDSDGSSVRSSGSVHAAWMQGVRAVALRRVLLHSVGFVAGVILARTLSPADVGTYFIANFYVTILGTLQTTNMAGALIQSRDAPTEKEETTLFTIEQALSLVAICLLVLAGVVIYALRPLHQAQIVFPYVLVFAWAWFINGFALIPNIRLTRGVQYVRIALADGLAELAFYVSAVVLALCGARAWSYVIAGLIQACLKAGTLSWMSPWRLRLGVSRDAARKYLLSGVCMQGVFVAHLARENLSPSLGALFYGSAGAGFYGWASSLAGSARIPSFIFIQLAFPTYARLQGEPRAISRLNAITFRITLLLAGLVMVVLLGFGEPLVHFVYGDKWRPALPVLYLCTASALFALFVGPHLHALLGTGRQKLALGINVAWTASVVLFACPLIWRFSYVGLAIADTACYAVAAGVFFVLADRETRMAALVTALRFSIALGLALALAAAVQPTPAGAIQVLIAVVMALLTYCLLSAALFWRTARADIEWLRVSAKTKDHAGG